MCNAWNHSPSCTCGWGGDGHLGRRTLFSSLIQSNVVFKTYRDLLLGFTNPNAKCPVCGASVYFYASPHGGRVFFDEIGPPWPKHPCTDRGNAVVKLALPEFQREQINKTFFKNGWVPYLCQDIRSLQADKSIIQLTGLIEDKKQTFFSKKDGLSEGAPFLVKQDEDGKIWLSTIVTSKFEIKADTFEVFKFESDVHSLYERKRPAINPYSRIANRKNKNQESKPRIEKTRSDSVVEKYLEKCDQCGAKVNDLAKHIERAHTNKKLFKCMQCGVEVRDLDRHNAKTHSVEAKIKSEYEKIRREKRKTALKDKRQKTKDKRQKTKDKRQKTKDKRQKTKDT